MKKSQVCKPLLSVQSLSTTSPMQCLLVATHINWAPQGLRLDCRDSEEIWPIGVWICPGDHKPNPSYWVNSRTALCVPWVRQRLRE